MTFDFDNWTADLSRIISNALVEFRTHVDEEMQMFAVDCHPWNGVIALAFLTSSELKQDPLLGEPNEMAAWSFYDFGAKLSSWHPATELATMMRRASDESGSDRAGIATQFLRSCGMAVASSEVQSSLLKFHQASEFRITVPHPDSNEEFYAQPD